MNDCKNSDITVINQSSSSNSQNFLFPLESSAPLTQEQELLKRQIYEQMQPRRRKFIDKMGYKQWNPFQAPKEPLDIRKDISLRTIQELISAYMKEKENGEKSSAWHNAIRECAIGIVNKDEKYQAIFDFCLWYYKILKNEGYLE